ncbi:sulfite oxidase [Pseudonocardia bannensis]|uniref:Sulfite oxidase n=1 Tax=Pseudonocardia bannensis TaxID=630973 RepID=A0A848DNR8_9PSEU|nr:sulfite oxidase [Pseudonocardia bannensis]NMH94470.1 sulfite oxidase [Pseudonocardia bannensis]
MALFIVRHEHKADLCPAADPYRGAALLSHLSQPYARRHGMEIRGKAVVQGEHTLYLIIESADEACVRRFMEPLAAAGSLDIHPASTCAGVVAGGGCAAPGLLTDTETVDPETACEDAVEAGLLVHRVHPLNCETSVPELIGGVVVPNARFYVRNHFPIPLLNPATWRLNVGGLVERPQRFNLDDLHHMPSQTLVVTLECAGNGRSLLHPPVEGEQWRLGAVSTAEWTGVPLVEVLDRAGPAGRARTVVLRGADGGDVPGRTAPLRFERSLSLDEARDSDALLAYAMNGEALPRHHGFPLRVVVPGWYAVASVKWLTEIEVIDTDFAGFFQADRYFYEWPREGRTTREPVALQQVRALITEPVADSDIPTGELTVRGVAWSGASPIARVEVSVGLGTWQPARLVGERRRHSWQWWELLTRVDVPGATTVRARATDLAGRTQPEQPVWNRLGYGINPVQEVAFRVR